MGSAERVRCWGDRLFIPVVEMPMFGLLLWVLSPEHTRRVPYSSLPRPLPGWMPVFGSTAAPFPGAVDDELLEAVQDALDMDLEECGLPRPV